MQLTLAAVLAMGDAIEKGSAAATAQMICVISLQLGYAAYVLLLVPACDRIHNAVHVTQVRVSSDPHSPTYTVCCRAPY